MFQFNTHRTVTSSWGYSSCAELGRNSLNNMPVDFAAYLMSASPPGLGFFGYNDDFNGKGYSVKCHVAVAPLKPIIIKKTVTIPGFEDQDVEPTSPGTDEEDCLSTSSDVDSAGEYTEKQNRPRKKKHVTFADSKGLALTKVKVVTESSDTPPKLQPQLLASLTQGASAGVSEKPPLALDFSQPASEYVDFRNRLDRQNVSLENVILKDYKVMGTIKVKNLSFEKHVFIRCSFDSWNSHVDIPANYVPSGGSPDAGHVMYDTFSFDITVPSTISRKQVVEFCVRYECSEGQFWDNAGGKNYRVISADHDEFDSGSSEKSYTTDYKPNFDYVNSWSEYSSWSRMNRDVPYY